MHQARNPDTVSQLLTRIQDLQNKVNSLSDGREFYDPETASSSGATHVPSQPSTVPSPMPCRDSVLPHDTRIVLGTTGNVLERLPAREGLPSALFENSSNLASSAHELRPDISGNRMVPERENKREPQNSAIPVPRFQSGGGTLNRTGGNRPHGGMIDYTRFPMTLEFQSWKVNFKTEVCSKSADPHLTMHWIKEVEIAKSIDELMTS